MKKLKRMHQVRERKQSNRCKKFRQCAITAGSVAAITLGLGIGVNKAVAAYTPDLHEVSVSQDADADLIADSEEVAIGYRAFEDDQNRNEIPDGAELAKRCAVDINDLPMHDGTGWSITSNKNVGETALTDNWLTIVDSESLVALITITFENEAPIVVNLSSDSAATDAAAGHSLEDVRNAINAVSLNLSVAGDGTAQAYTAAEIVSEDGIYQLKLNSRTDDASNMTMTMTGGVDAVTRAFTEESGSLLNTTNFTTAAGQSNLNSATPNETYKWHIAESGDEICDICGAVVNEGPAGIVNPNLGLSVDCSLLAIHYMSHGSFNYAGDVHGAGRIDVAALLRAIDIRYPNDPNDHQLPLVGSPGWTITSNKNVGETALTDDWLNLVDAASTDAVINITFENEALIVVNLSSDTAATDAAAGHSLKDVRNAINAVSLNLPVAGDGTVQAYTAAEIVSEDGIYQLKLNSRTTAAGSMTMYISGGVDTVTGAFTEEAGSLLNTTNFTTAAGEAGGGIDIGDDLDGDLLTDSEELDAGLDLYDADQDDDITPDGIELARQCGSIIDQLPWENEASSGETYKWHEAESGDETCDICGVVVNKGPAGIVNPNLGLSVDCSLLAKHYLSHGSFSYAGDVHGQGRIDVAALAEAIEIPKNCGDLGTVYLPGDLNKDCKVNFTDFGEFANKWLDSTDPN